MASRSRSLEQLVTPSADRRAMIAIMTSATMVGAMVSFSFPLMSLVLERKGVSPDLIGLNAAAFALAIFVIAPWLPGFVNRLGAVPSILTGQILCIVCLLALPLRVDLLTWTGLRFLLGLGTVLSWVASETAINGLAEESSRGRVLAAYATLFCVGYALGPALIVVTGSQGHLPFLLAAALLAVGMLPLALARGVDQALSERGSCNLLSVWRLAPLALGAILVFGLIETSGFALLPIYGLALGYNEAGAAFLLTLLIAGNVLFQLPIGWLADRVRRDRVLIGCAAVSTLALLAWPVALDAPAFGWPLLIVSGGMLGAMYMLSMALLGQRFRGTDLAVANTAFVLMYQIGAMAGPALGGLAMRGLGPHGLPLLLAAALGVFVVLALVGGGIVARSRRLRVPRQQRPWPGREAAARLQREVQRARALGTRRLAERPPLHRSLGRLHGSGLSPGAAIAMPSHRVPPRHPDMPPIPQDGDGPVFREPWEAQAFAMVLDLYDKGRFTWSEWVRWLSAEIAAAEERGEADLGDAYYRHWLAALEKLLAAKGLSSAEELAARRDQWAEADHHRGFGEPIVLGTEH